jgi:hypothetical protein
MFKTFKQDKKLKAKSFKTLNTSKLNDVKTQTQENVDTKDKLSFNKPKPKKKPPTDEQIFGTTPYQTKSKKTTSSTKKANNLGKSYAKKLKSAFKF